VSGLDLPCQAAGPNNEFEWSAQSLREKNSFGDGATTSAPTELRRHSTQAFGRQYGSETMIVSVLTFALLQAGAVDSAACLPDRLLQTTVPENRVVLLGTLQKVEDGDTGQLPTFGGSDVARLLVKVRLRGVVRGDEGMPFLVEN